MALYRKDGTRRLASQLMLTPVVIGMRLPMLALEAGSGIKGMGTETSKAMTEKVAAVSEGVAAAQLSMVSAAIRFWPEVFSGRTPALLNGVAVERAMHAALKPAGRAVKANYSRLSGKSAGRFPG
jgi:hypothetical protein